MEQKLLSSVITQIKIEAKSFADFQQGLKEAIQLAVREWVNVIFIYGEYEYLINIKNLEDFRIEEGRYALIYRVNSDINFDL